MALSPRVVARVVGGLSVAAAVGLVVSPRPLLALFGLPARPWLGRLLAARDVVAGVGLLMSERPGPWLRARATFDAADGALVALEGARRGRVALTVGRVLVAAASSGLSWSAARRAGAASAGP